MEEKDVLFVENLVKPEYEKIRDWSHGWLHILGVKESSIKLATAENYDTNVSAVLAYCHDLGRVLEEQDSSLGSHSVLSIEPSVRILQQIGVKGKLFGSIIEAIAVHSYKDYQGKDLAAKVLRDADKSEALGPKGVLRAARYILRRDFVDTDLIFRNYHNQELMDLFAKETLERIKKDPEALSRYLKDFSFTLEWINEKMFDTNSAYRLFEEEMKYIKKSHEFLLS
ncbi:MAG: HD domain-containing protein [Nanoarchaeota archaeon]|nr:HD domain-containing protein [Nanoarchaeota archaeon]